MKAIRALFILAFLSTIALAGDKVPLATRAQEIEHAEDQFSIVARPEGKSLNDVLQCRAQDLFDAQKLIFTDSDFKALSQLKCNDKFCVGDKAPFESTLAIAVKRNNERIEFLKSMKDIVVNIHGEDTVPGNLSWKKYAKSDDELKGRWLKILTFYVMKEVMKAKHPEQANVKELQNKIIDLMVADLAAQNDRWNKFSDTEKEESLLHARLTCLDKYARIIRAEEIKDRGVNSVLVDYPITMGIKFVDVPNDGVIISGMIPGSKASLSKQFKRGDKVKAITYNGKKFDATKPEAAIFNMPLEAGKPLEIEVERNGEPLTLKTETGQTLPYESIVIAHTRTVDGKRFRVVSIPMYVGEDKNLSPDEKISTAAQVQYALADRENYDAVVLDLRGNGGGVAEQGALLPALFLSEKENPTSLVFSKEKGEVSTQIRNMNTDKPFSKVPLFVLAGQDSASSSEITISALLKTNRAVVIGEPTYGKGVEQVGVPLKDGSMLLQTSHVNVNFGDEPFHKKGLKPHLNVPFLSGIMKNEKESQEVGWPDDSDKVPKPSFTNDYYQVNQEALEQTKSWAKRAQKTMPTLQTYYGAMKRLSEIHNAPTYVLNLEKAQQIQADVAENESQVVQMGALDSAKTPFTLGTATDWSLFQAAHYLTLEKEMKEKAEAATK